MELGDEIYDRQKTIINIKEDLTCMVIGVGGIGSWVAWDLALLGVKNLIIIDPDRLEPTNLNRTPFELAHIGELKVDAVKDLIEKRRKDVIVLTHDERLEERILEKYENVDFIFDCTDNLRTKDIMKDKIKCPYVKCGYDGFEATISKNDWASGAWGEENGYQVTPSFFGTPQAIASLVITEMLLHGDPFAEESINFDLREILSKFRVERRKKKKPMETVVLEQAVFPEVVLGNQAFVGGNANADMPLHAQEVYRFKYDVEDNHVEDKQA